MAGRRAGKRRLRYALYGLAGLLVLLIALGVPLGLYLRRDEPVVYEDVVEQFKYGSVGTEEEQGVPFLVWAVLPDVFADLLPAGEGSGYERLGFLYEPGSTRPIGTTIREKPVPLLGVNCSLCHTGTLRAAPDAERRLVYGMPANRFRIGDYIEFLRAVGKDERFDADTLLPAIERRFPGELSRLERLFYRYVVIPQTRDGLRDLDEDFRWVDGRPAFGPGRVDTFDPWKERFDFDMSAEDAIGTADYPSIWDQRPRRGLALHWDGNNPSLLERNISASLAVGATAGSLDLGQLGRVAEWLLDLKPPAFPSARIDSELAARGKAIYDRECASCHDVGGTEVGTVTALARLGTDAERLRSFSPELAEKMNTLGEGEPWAFSHFRSTDGYANSLLDGIWLRAPYLHNGSVPDLRSLLVPEERPEVFYTGYDVYDWKRLGFVSSGPDARREGFRFDTRLQGNGNGGHLFGSDLRENQIEALLEYLKTL